MSSAASSITKLGFIDSLIVLMSIALGIWASSSNPAKLEAALGLGSTQAGFERAIGERRRPIQAEHDRIPRVNPSLVQLTTLRFAIIRWAEHIIPLATLGVATATFRHQEFRNPPQFSLDWRFNDSNRRRATTVSLANEFVLRRFPSLVLGYRHNSFESLWQELGVDVSLGVVSLWAVLAVGGRWRAAPIWPDRLGRAVGVAWVLIAVLSDLLQHALRLS